MSLKPSLQPAPIDNHLLASLPADVWSELRPQLEWVSLRVGMTLHEAGVVLSHAVFPTTATVSLVSSMKNGASSEVAVVGNEGVVGVCAFMAGGVSLTSAVVQSAGHGLRMKATAIDSAAKRSGPLMQALLRYTQALFMQMAQTSACNRHHGLEQRLCRWLLTHHDRGQGDELLATQERIAGMLGARREGVTAGAFKLQQAGVIGYSRGRITVLDRAGLEARSCECHDVIKSAHDRLRQSPAGQPRRAETMAWASRLAA